MIFLFMKGSAQKANLGSPALHENEIILLGSAIYSFADKVSTHQTVITHMCVSKKNNS